MTVDGLLTHEIESSGFWLLRSDFGPLATDAELSLSARYLSLPGLELRVPLRAVARAATNGWMALKQRAW